MQSKRRWLPGWQRVELAEKVELEGWSCRQAAAWRRVAVSTVHHWVARRRAASGAELESGSWAEDRASTPQRQPRRSSEEVHDRVCAARRRTGWGPRLIAGELAMAHSTVSRCLERRGLSRAPRPVREQVCRYEWPCPGDLLHMDVKRFARFSSPGHAVTGERRRSGAEKRERVGYEFAHSIVDDHSRLAYTELLQDERAATVTGFTERALAFFCGHGLEPKRLMTDNHFSYTKNSSLRAQLARHGIRHLLIRSRRPETNGKVERYQQTLKREWGLGQRYRSSDHRARALPHWLDHYNERRPHSAIGNRPPITRVRNLSGQNS